MNAPNGSNSKPKVEDVLHSFRMGKLVASSYRYGTGSAAIYIEERGNDRWAITTGSACLNTDFQWEVERTPSNRTDDFLNRNRYSLEEAEIHLANAIAKGVI